MTNPHRTALLTLLKLCDLGVVATAFTASMCLALPGDQWPAVLEMRVKVRNICFMATYLGYWHLVLRGFGLYLSHRLSPIFREWRDLGSAVVFSALPVFLLGGIFHFQYATATFLVAFSGLAFLGLALERRLFRVLARRIRRHGRNLRNAIVVGNGEGALEMASRLARRADLGYRIVELVEVEGPIDPRRNGAGDPAVVSRIAALVAREPIDEVFVAVPLDAGQHLIRAIVALCEEQGITVRVLSSIVDLILAQAQVDELDGRPVITIFSGPPDSLGLLFKRVIDFSIALAALTALAPLFVVLAMLIRLDSRGSAFFVQERVGLNRRRFRLYKFRTMVADAEDQQAALEPLNEASGPVFKIRNDPRLTRAGRMLRKLSLDELPQLYNVLKGDMSLVGPRPLPLRDVSRFDVNAHKRRFSMKPGITCLWQVNGREPEFDDWIKTDMEYIDNWSLRLDLRILMKTIPAVLSGRGAY